MLHYTEQEVDGESFRELSSSSDPECQLQCTFTFGGKRKLRKLMASICAGPSGMFVKILMTLYLILLSFRCCHLSIKEIDIHKDILGPASSLE